MIRLLPLILLVFALPAIGQLRTVDEGEFDEVYRVQRESQKLPRIETMVRSVKRDGAVVETEKTVLSVPFRIQIPADHV